MNSEDRAYIDHEVRVRILEEIAKDTREKIDKNFHTLLNMQIGTILAIVTMFGGLLLSKFL
jgi:hypothetical protein